MGSPLFLVGFVLLIFLIFCCVFLFLFVLSAMLPVSLDCLFSYCVLCDQCSPCLWIVCFRTVSCVTNVPRVSGLFVLVLCLMWPMFPVSLDCLFSYCVLCDQCSPCVWIVCFRTVSYVTNVPRVSRLFVYVLCLVWPMFPVCLDCLSSYCVLCDQCSPCLWIIHSWFPLTRIVFIWTVHTTAYVE